MAFTDYRGLDVWSPLPTGPAGVVLNTNFEELADRSGPIHTAAAIPDANDDEVDTNGNGKFYVWSKWLDTNTDDLYICIDATATAAVWSRIHYDDIKTADFDEIITFNTTQMLFLPDQAAFTGTIIVGDGGTNLVHTLGVEGHFNIGIGMGALKENTKGDSNKAFGHEALEDNTLGERNLAFGYHALRKNISGDNNVALGDESLMDNTTGSENVCIGNLAGEDITGDGNICIGHMAGEGQITISNRLYIDNSDTATPLIYGEFDNDLIKINGDLYIPSDSKKLFLGAVATNYTIAWDGNDAVHTITAGDFVFTGGNVGLGETAPQDTLEVNGTVLVKDKLKFTQDDGDEYIDSLNDGFVDIGATTAVRVNVPIYLTQIDGVEYIDSIADGYVDIGAGTSIRLNAVVLATDKIKFTQTDGNEYVDSNNDNYLDLGATTQIRLNAPTLADGKISLKQTDGNEYIDGSNDNYVDIGATTAIRMNTDTHILGDGTIVSFGVPGDSDYTIQWDGADAVHTITAGDFTFMGGNVGIGMADPAFKLEVNGKIGIDDEQVIYLPDQTNFLNSIFFGDGGGSLSHIDGTDGQNNIGVGKSALLGITIGAYNTVTGFGAGAAITTGTLNVVIGTAFYSNTSGDKNTAIGNNTLINNLAGNENVAIGYAAGQTNTGDSSIFIGNSAGAASGAVSNKLYIDNTNSATPLIYGEFDNDLIKIHGHLHIPIDNKKLYSGAADDVSITYTGSSWVFDIEAATATISMNPDGDDTDFVFGSAQLADVGTAAQDSRMFFDKGKGAFRAGKVEATEWDAPGDQSTAFGLGCSAAATCSTALGQSSKANKYGQQAQAGGLFAAQGDAQGSIFIARKSVIHNDAAWYPLFLDGVDDQMLIASDAVWTFDILLVGTTSGCTKSFGFKIEGVIENDGGTTTILASNVTTLYDADDVSFDAKVVADDGTDALVVEVSDSDGTGDTVQWVAKVSTAECTF